MLRAIGSPQQLFPSTYEAKHCYATTDPRACRTSVSRARHSLYAYCRYFGPISNRLILSSCDCTATGCIFDVVHHLPVEGCTVTASLEKPRSSAGRMLRLCYALTPMILVGLSPKRTQRSGVIE